MGACGWAEARVGGDVLGLLVEQLVWALDQVANGQFFGIIKHLACIGIGAGLCWY